jgi:cadmium resistance protein CadD (predicted permease)
VSIRLIGQAIGLFAVTNIDDIVILALFFGQATRRSGALQVVAGQYLGFTGILAASVIRALGAELLPETVIAHLGLLPLALGLRAAWTAVRDEHRARGDDHTDGPEPGRSTAHPRPPASGPGVFAVAAVTFANGGDNIGVYVPVFATTGTSALLTYVLIFLVLVAVWCAAGYFVARHSLIAKALARWGHILLPIVLIGIGVLILIEGHALGL